MSKSDFLDIFIFHHEILHNIMDHIIIIEEPITESTGKTITIEDILTILEKDGDYCYYDYNNMVYRCFTTPESMVRDGLSLDIDSETWDTIRRVGPKSADLIDEHVELSRRGLSYVRSLTEYP